MFRVVRTIQYPFFVSKIYFYIKTFNRPVICRNKFCRNVISNESIIPPPFLFRSRRNGVPKPSKKNWPSGKESSTLVSDIYKISILSLIISAKESNLFGIELIFRFAKISLLRLSLRIV